MAQGTVSATATSSQVLAASDYRGYVIIQLISGDPIAIGIGEDAVYGEGVHLLTAGDAVKLVGADARKAINVICDTGNTASGAYQSG